MSNFKKFVQNYIDQVLTLNQLIRLNSQFRSGQGDLLIIRTFNKHNVKGKYLFLLVWNTLINSVEILNFSTYYETKYIRVYIMSESNSPLLLHRTFELTRDRTFDDYWSEIKDQIIDLKSDYYYINIAIYNYTKKD